MIKRTLVGLGIAIIILTSFASCQTTGDKLLVSAEITERTANDTFDAFVHLDRANETWIKANAPAVHQYANIIRRNGVTWLKSARAATVAYESNRTPEGKANLDTALAVLNVAVQQSTIYIAAINAHSTTSP